MKCSFYTTMEKHNTHHGGMSSMGGMGAERVWYTGAGIMQIQEKKTGP